MRLSLYFHFCLPLIYCLFLLIISSKSFKVNIYDEQESKATKQFTTNCHYSPHYEDFYWIWGCPAQIHEYGIKSKAKGFWSPCKKSSCEIYSNIAFSTPSSISVEVFIEGDGFVEISVKLGSIFSTFTRMISRTFAGHNNLCYGTIFVDLAQHSDFQGLNITAVQGRKGFVLIDKISVCFNDGITDCLLEKQAISTNNSFQCTNDPVPTSTTTSTISTTTTMPSTTTSETINTTLATIEILTKRNSSTANTIPLVSSIQDEIRTKQNSSTIPLTNSIQESISLSASNTGTCIVQSLHNSIIVQLELLMTFLFTYS